MTRRTEPREAQPLEGDIQGEVIKALRKLGVWFMRVQCGQIRVRRGFMQLAPKGTADLLVLTHGATLWLEMKKHDGKQEPEQIEFQRRVESLGHKYLVARSVADVLAVL